MHRGNAEICQNKIKFFVCDLVNFRKIHAANGQNILAKAQLCQTFSCLFRFNRVYIRRVHVSLSVQALQHAAGVPAISQCGIIADLSRLNLQKIQNFLHHNRNVHTGRRLALSDDFFDVVLILFRIQLFVFFAEFARMRTLVPLAAFVWLLLFHDTRSFSQYTFVYRSMGRAVCQRMCRKISEIYRRHSDKIIPAKICPMVCLLYTRFSSTQIKTPACCCRAAGECPDSLVYRVSFFAQCP